MSYHNEIQGNSNALAHSCAVTIVNDPKHEFMFEVLEHFPKHDQKRLICSAYWADMLPRVDVDILINCLGLEAV